MSNRTATAIESLENRIQFDGGVTIIVGGGGATSIYNNVVSYASRGTGPQGITWGDFNRDGKPDIAFTNKSSGTVGVMLNNGNGTFGKAAIYTGAGSNLNGIITVDLNGDKLLDIAYVGNDLAVMLGKGNGTFNAATHIPVGNRPTGLAVGDFNKDGYYDLITANSLSNNVSTVLNRGKGRWYGAINTAAGDGPTSVATGDFNTDGKLDVAVTNMGANLTGSNTGVRIMVGANTGRFTLGKLLKAGTRPIQVAVADLNKDGKLDLVTANGGAAAQSDGQNTISVLTGIGGGSFNTRRAYEAGRGASSLVIADVNRDKKLDIVVTNYLDNSVSILKGDGTSAFTTLETKAGVTGNIGIVVSDWNMDGKADLATVGFGSAAIGVYIHK